MNKLRVLLIRNHKKMSCHNNQMCKTLKNWARVILCLALLYEYHSL